MGGMRKHAEVLLLILVICSLSRVVYSDLPLVAMKTAPSTGYGYIPSPTGVYCVNNVCNPIGTIAKMKVEEWCNMDSSSCLPNHPAICGCAKIQGDITGGANPYPGTNISWPDAVVNLNDLVLISHAYNRNEGDVGFNYMADIIPDRIVNLEDWVLFSWTYNQNGNYSTDLNDLVVTFDNGVSVGVDNTTGYVDVPAGVTSFNVYRGVTMI